MDVQTWTFIIVGGTFALYIGIAIWSKASTTGDFYIAGRGVHPVVEVVGARIARVAGYPGVVPGEDRGVHGTGIVTGGPALPLTGIKTGPGRRGPGGPAGASAS